MPTTHPKHGRRPAAAEVGPKQRRARRDDTDARPEPLARAPRAEASPEGRARRAKPLATPGTDRWSESASFMVYVEHKRRNGVDECRTVAERRTAAHHIETGAKMSWPGVALDECARWMLGQLPVGVPHGDAPNPATSSAGPAPAQAGSVPHSFDEVRLLQAGARSAYPLFIQGRRHPACIAADRAWLLEFVLGDVRRPSPQTARQRLDVHAIDHARGIRTLLGSLELHAPTPGRPIGAVVDVAHGALPQGSYALECCVETDGHRVAMLRLPLLEVCRSFDATGRRLADSDAYATGKRCGTRASIAAS